MRFQSDWRRDRRAKGSVEVVVGRAVRWALAFTHDGL
jgi:hypothetical protein